MPGFLQLLTAYLLDSIAGSEQDETAQGLRETFTRRYTPERWKRELDRQSSNLQVLVLSELITNAASWAFDGGGSTGE
jgi:predicted chitinase